MEKPPRAFSVPPADDAGEDISLNQIAQQIDHTREPWVMMLKDDLITLKIALVTSDDWQLNIQKQVFFPVLTVKELVDFLAWARRRRIAGAPLTLRDLKTHCELRVRMGRAPPGFAYVRMEPEPPLEEPEEPGSRPIPKGWTHGNILACTVCGGGVVLRDTRGRPMHVVCAARRR